MPYHKNPSPKTEVDLTVLKALQAALVELQSFVPFTEVKVIDEVKNAIYLLKK